MLRFGNSMGSVDLANTVNRIGRDTGPVAVRGFRLSLYSLRILGAFCKSQLVLP
jgi:hypothetical protein